MRPRIAPALAGVILAFASTHAARAATPKEPTDAFVDVAVSVLGASTRSDDQSYYTSAAKAVGAMRDYGHDCVVAGKGDCVVEKDGLTMGFGTGRFSAVLRASAGYATRDVLVAVEDGGGMRIVDPDAYMFSLNTEKIRIVQRYLAMCGVRY